MNESPYAVIDIGSNGIRLSITSPKPDLTILLEERCGISLFSKEKFISESIINEVVINLKRFQSICNEYSVNKDRFIIVATEATRVASNSDQFLSEIKKQLNWDVRLLSKEEEAKFTTVGLAEGLEEAKGAVLDLGGGSLELNYLTKAPNKEVSISPNGGSFSLGARVIEQHLNQINGETDELKSFSAGIKQQIVQSPWYVTHSQEIENLYLCGGGFRSVGYISMHELEYPIRIIQNYCAKVDDLIPILKKYSKLTPDQIHRKEIFGISKSRCQMIAGNCLLLLTILKILPKAESVYFGLGGVRVGVLRELLGLQPNLQTDVFIDYCKLIGEKDSEWIDRGYDLLLPLLSQYKSNKGYPCILTNRIIKASVALSTMYDHRPKHLQSLTAFNIPLESGDLNSINSLQHIERVCLALILGFRYGGDIPHNSLEPISNLVQKGNLKLCKLIGLCLKVILCINAKLDSISSYQADTKTIFEIEADDFMINSWLVTSSIQKVYKKFSDCVEFKLKSKSI